METPLLPPSSFSAAVIRSLSSCALPSSRIMSSLSLHYLWDLLHHRRQFELNGGREEVIVVEAESLPGLTTGVAKTHLRHCWHRCHYSLQLTPPKICNQSLIVVGGGVFWIDGELLAMIIAFQC
ncbi:hypothetical protein PIB30_007068 [Stylosanthes scabra]|uniref:Uncharacterized protein n=1 Tax=Stylosanthes scabra TaxID=79078 RepID=A0ABU6R3D4_9FABA|nr:hypothetical protein [Stylosanthes scabra]